MPDQQLSLHLPAHQNRQLFSDHYLNEILPTFAGWRMLASPAETALTEIAGIFDRFVPSENERQTEDNLVCPMLRALGHSFEVQAPLRTPDGAKVPDYVFYRDDTALATHKNLVLTEAVAAEGAFAIGDAKYWNRPLDIAVRAKGADALSNKNPSYQIYFYMLHSGVEWGILTNGKLWRLYHRDTAHKLDVYYEVDLEELVRAGNVERFLYFYAFFRRAAFDPGPLCLTDLLRASVEYAYGVGMSLKDQVYDALRHLAQGFLDYRGNSLQPTPEALKETYDNALILLYRLIFILYAEARELLPVRESELYRETYSLLAIKQAVARGRRLLPTSARLWPQLRELFQAINQGSPPLHVATFNGGLFDPAKHPFLEHYTVGDAHLQQAIDKLARIDGQFIDYRDLSVRHMGTIYEGLLEYHLQPSGLSQPPMDAPALAFPPAAERDRDCPRSIDEQPSGLSQPPMDAPALAIPPAAERDRDCPRSIDAAATPALPVINDNPKSKIQNPKFTIDLVNDKGERKATGSYYTPDYIVKFIVEQTVGPVLWEAVSGKSTDDEIARAVLAVNVLDPAMGSGHFLVEATEYIARFLVDYGILPEGKTPEEADLAYWKRRVVQSCIYGVDINPLAVELAKLSLWLITVAKDRPLSFLDHHLRPGNSLVGARLEQIQPKQKRARENVGRRKTEQARANGQISLFDDSAFTQRVKLAVDNMWLIEDSEARNVGEVKQQEAIYADLRRQFVAKYARLLHLSTAAGFGLAIDPRHWPALLKYVTNGNGTAFPAFDTLLQHADELATRERFFHWEIEFPEVFFDRFGRHLGEDGGFDVVIGNPPYIRQEGLAPYKSFFETEYPEVYHGAADIFVYFFAQGLRQAKRGGRHSYISSNSWLRTNYATPLRRYLRTAATVEMLVDLDDNHVFAEAPDVYPAIHIVRNAPPAANHAAQAAVFTRSEGLQPFETKVDEKLFSVDIHDQPDSGWQLSGDASRRLFARLIAAGKLLGEVVNGQMYRGVLTGLNEAFIINQQTRDQIVAADPACSSILKKMLRGEDLRPWYQEDEERWLIFTRRGIDIDAYPAVKQYLEQFRDRLEPKPENWNDAARWPGRKPGNYRWYEIQDTVEYYEAFEQPKIMWPDISKFPRFSWDKTGYYLGNTGYILLAEPWLLGILASRCAWFMISHIAISLGERAGVLRYRLIDQYMKQLPIPAAPPADREAIGALAMTITERARERYALHLQVRHRLHTDFGAPDKVLNNRLTAWWTLDFPALRDELQKVFKRDIPMKNRDDVEAWLTAQCAEHAHLTSEIVTRETDLNACVYALFGLTDEEITLIEESTKYRYGDV